MDSHYKPMFADACRELAGHQTRSLLKAFVSKDSMPGEVALFDTIEPSDDATFTAMAGDTNYRADYEAIGVPVLADWQALQTPHMNVAKNKVIVSPYENLWAHWFRKKDNIGEAANKDSKILKQGMKKIYQKQDDWILNALSRSTEQRGKDATSAASIAFPSANQITEGDGIFDMDTILQIQEIYEGNYLGGEKIFCAISPSAKRALINASGDKLRSTDFVDSSSYFKTGNLPDIEGVHFIVHPNVTAFSGGATDAFFCWTEDAIMFNQFDAFETDLGEVASQKFNKVLMLSEYFGTCRLDDSAIIQGSLT